MFSQSDMEFKFATVLETLKLNYISLFYYVIAW